MMHTSSFLRFGAAVLFSSLAGMGCSQMTAGSYDAAQDKRPVTMEVAAMRDPAPKLGVVTTNMWHKDRPEELKVVADHLRAEVKGGPDFILCQEVVFNRGGPQDNTAAVLAANLGFHSRGTKRTSDGEGVAIVSRYPFAHYDALHLASQTSPFLLGFRRVSVMGEFNVPNVGLVRVVNVHFTNWGFEAHVRRNQLRETLEWVGQRERVAPAAITFLGGDFNAKPDSEEMQIVRDFRLPSGIAFRNHNGQEPSMGAPGDPDKRIDFIFIASAADNATFAREALLWKGGLPKAEPQFFLSDHLPVMHVYSVQRPVRPVASAN
jgi:endonuclease/exonuclease/phosphatase family metal-dependent hydrolase